MLGTDAFLSLARAQAAKHGLPHLPVCLVSHPIGGVDPALVRGRAEAIVDEVLAGLTRDPVPPARLTATVGAAATEAPEDLDAFQEWAMAQRWSMSRMAAQHPA